MSDREKSGSALKEEGGSLAMEEALGEATALGPGGRLDLAGLYGASRAWFLSRLAGATARTVLAVLPTDEDVEEFSRDLAFFLGPGRVKPFPGTETLPFEPFPPHPEVLSARVEALHALAGGGIAGGGVVVASAASVARKTVPADWLRERAFTIEFGGEYDMGELAARLVDMGYARMSMVEERGEFSVRGGILDVFPPSCADPLRVEFFGDEVESIRPFDISTQRSKKEVERVEILPPGELDFSREARSRARERLMDRADELEIARSEWEGLSGRLREGVSSPDICSVLSYLHPRMDTLFDYLPEGSPVALVDPGSVEAALTEDHDEVVSAAGRLTQKGEFFVEPEGLFLTPDEVRSLAGSRAVIGVESMAGGGRTIECRSNLDLRQEIALKKGSELLAPLAARVRGWIDEGYNVFVTSHNRGQAERTVELLEGYDLKPRTVPGRETSGGSVKGGGLYVATGVLSTGFRLPGELLAVVSEEEVFGERTRHRAPSKKVESFLTQLQDLSEGDCIVHTRHGIGVYSGLERMEVDGVAGDFLLLEYRDGDKLYLPVWRMDQVAKYRGVEGGRPKLDKLGGTGWGKTKKRVRKAVEKLAGELLKLYAERQVAEGHAYSSPGHLFDEFTASFEFEETPDQAQAIEETMADMDASTPMDRLVCGDVGYGKTEVAMRAAFRAVLDGKQVAVLVPTTVLAQQHYKTFTERFAPYPVEVEVLSRFKTRPQQKEAVEKVSAGRADMVVGTHRLLARDVEFKDLGLIVVDEEHRFGVTHKERLKQLRKKVDVLTLTATPIPRTLNMAMASIRELSIIATPPQDRLAIKTSVIRFDDEVVAEAIEREMARGGQVFFVHNRINTMPAMEEFLRRAVPRARVATAHGRMKESELEKRMLGFVNREYDVLLSTAIIESGLDIPSANTIIINRADTFGLADLYQLRGRVGRSNRRAYAYFITPEPAALTPEARKRIEVIGELTEPGSGFQVASYDLEIRGAGELLGTQQSGRIAEVGFDMYARLLEEAVGELRGEVVEEEFTPEITLRVSQYIPGDYVPDTRQRLGLYKRLASATEEEELAGIVDEMRDRYGEMPELTENLVRTMDLKLRLRELRARELSQKGKRLYFTFAEHPHPEAAERRTRNALALAAKKPDRYRLTPDSRLIVYMGLDADPDPFAEARYVLKELSRE